MSLKLESLSHPQDKSKQQNRITSAEKSTVKAWYDDIQTQ